MKPVWKVIIKILDVITSLWSKIKPSIPKD